MKKQSNTKMVEADSVAILVALLVILLTVKIIKFIRSRRELLKLYERGNVPCAPGAGLLSGHLFRLFKPENNAQLLHELHGKLGKTYGTFYGPYPWVFTCDADLLHRLFVTEGHKFININLYHLPLPSEFSESLAQLQNDDWRRLRRSLNPSFTPKQMKSDNVYNDVAEANERILKSIAEHPVDKNDEGGRRSRIIDVLYLSKKLAIEVVFKVSFGRKDGVDLTPMARDPLIDDIHLASKSVRGPVIWSCVLVDFLQRIGSSLVKYTLLGKSFRHIHTIMSDSVAARKRLSRKEVERNRKMIDSIMESVAESNLGEETLKSSLFFIFVAGFETTASSLAILVWLLAHHPDKQAKLRAAVLAGQEDCEYLLWCIKEGMRLYAPVPTGFGRELPEDIHHNGMTFFKGTNIIASVHTMHHLKEYWGDDVEEFRPERFANPNLHPCQWLPFAAGPRVCLGYNLAMLELRTIMARLIVRYHLEPCPSTPAKIDAKAPNLIHILIDGSIDVRFVELT